MWQVSVCGERERGEGGVILSKDAINNKRKQYKPKA